ncbi:DUF11 domain-containing protein [Aeromicrobium phragmitis]|uniref:DUF11 domain-containing protein n=1 Tax=Aeromicrobium phragmitis TaxID=2478914 RepID=A0A3L8PLF7_9ACTN|nr:DUF11 domain-containing protein [Aeromicrobium phragmitis]RLV56181.1 DUF11 domain-containing protein [Aeromicrobium phragmitis]
MKDPRRRGVALAGVLSVLAGVLAATPMLTASPAHAAPGDPFDPADPYVFVAQNQPTQLFKALTDASGNTSFEPEGGPSDLSYNAIGYNPADHYLYGIVNVASASIPLNSLVRIGQGGVVTRVGTQTFTPSVIGTFGPADGHLYTVGYVDGVQSLEVIDVSNGTLVRHIPLVGGNTTGYDIAYKDGFFWSLGGGLIARIDPASGATTQFAAPFPTDTNDQAGAAWTYGNDNLGFSFNNSGTVYQVAVTNPAAPAPTFTLVSTNPGPSSAANDGAASPGQPTDLAIVKEGPEAVIPGGTVTYTLTVTNNGPGNSSGFVVDDVVPAPLTNVATVDAGCTVTGNAVQCVGGRLVAGDSVSYTITASVPDDVDGTVENTATVTANEEDPTPDNNTSTNSSDPAGLSVLKEAGTPTDVNANGITDAGDTIQYTFEVTNTGDVVMTDLTVNDPLVGAVTCPQASLAPGASQTCAADAVYTITAQDVANGSVDNTATVTGTTPDGDQLTSAPSTTTTPTEAPAAGITVVKSADLDAGYQPGQEVTYRFVVTNTGNVPLADVAVNEVAFSGTGDLSAITCPTTTLAAGAQVVCEATYTLTTDDVDAGEVTNTATATGTPGDGTPVTSAPSEYTIPLPADPGISVVKSADPGTIAAAGQTVTYSFLVTNTGNVTMTDVAVNETDFSGSGELSAVDCPTATLYAGQVVTCTATYTVTQADVDAGGSLTNTATVTGTPPDGTPLTSTPSTSTVEVTQSPALSVLKTADVDAGEVGQTITYSFLVTNTGNVTISDPTVNDTEFSGTGDLSAISCPDEDTLAPGEEITCTATYTLTQADIDSGEVTNTATVSGTSPTGDPVTSTPSTETVTTDPMPALSVVKTADVEEITKVGQVVTYAFEVRNIGNVTITDATVNEVEFSGAGDLSAVTCPDDAEALAPGDSVTCSATYTVVAADLASGELSNTATATGGLPGGGTLTSEPSTVSVDSNPPAATPGEDQEKGGWLPSTGAELTGTAVGLGLVLMALGGAALTLRGRRREGDDVLS